MDSNSGGLIAVAISWGIALLVGALAASILLIMGGWTPLQGIFAGALIFMAVGSIISLVIMRPLPGPVMPGTAGVHAPTARATVRTTPSAPATAASARASAPAPAPEPIPEPTPEPVESGNGPERLTGPRGGEADDLKKIKGVGPKLEGVLHGMGFYHFDQIAGWSDAEIAWVDENLEGFKGRVSRDNWVDQARQLAAGAETEFSRKVDKGGVY